MVQQAEALQETQQSLQEQTGQLAEEAEEAAEEGLTPEEQAAREQKQEELAGQQQEIEEKTQDLLEQMERLAQEQAGRNEEMSQGLKESLKQSEEMQLSQSQQDAAEQLQAGQMEQARQSQQRSSEGLSQLAQNLSSAMSAMGGMDFERDMAALRRVLDRALVLSDRQEKVALRLTPGGEALHSWGHSPLKTEVTIFQRYFRDEALRVEESLRQLAQEDPFLDFEAIRLLRLSARAMNRALEWAEDQSVPSVHNQVRLGLSEINQAILVLLDSLNSLSQAQASSSLSGYFQSLEQLIKRQRKLNQDTRQQRKRGQVPGWQEQMQRLADEQAAIRRKTEELLRKYGELEQLLQNLDQAGQEMRDVEKQLEDQIADDRVQEKQEQILTRLLDAEKSLQEQGTSKERQSETAGRFVLESPVDLPETSQSIHRRVQKLRQGIGIESIPLEYQERVRHYFRSLSEESGWK